MITFSFSKFPKEDFYFKHTFQPSISGAKDLLYGLLHEEGIRCVCDFFMRKKATAEVGQI